MTPLPRHVRRRATLAALALLAACGADRATGPRGSGTSYAGFDTSIYPGDSALAAWTPPGSPYRWVGYYLAAPCHHDTSWAGRRAHLTSTGWGTAVIYVGQQAWGSLASLRPALAHSAFDVAGAATTSTATAPTCSAGLLSAAQGAADGDDAITRTAAEGFPLGTTIWLDVEHMDSIPSPMLRYYAAWVERVLVDGRYRPGTYAHLANAPALHAEARNAYDAHEVLGEPPFWVASSAGFALGKRPTDVGLSYAAAWQGRLDVTERWNGVSVLIDVDVAARPSPSAP